MLTRLLKSLAFPLGPTLHTVRNYSGLKFRKDLVAGLTVSVVELPQAMAYALIAGVPPQYGIYASVLQGILGALLSSSEHLTTGPTNTQSLLIAATLSQVAIGHAIAPAEYLQLAFALTVLKGVFQLSFWAGRFGDLVHLISRSVIVGIATGAGLLIITGQLAAALGVAKEPPSSLIGVPSDLARIWPHVSQLDPLSISICLGTLLIVIGARKINRFIPGALIAVVGSSILVAVMGWEGRVATIGALEAEWPHFNIPPLDWNTIRLLASGALALAILGGIESIAIAKAIAGRSGERIDANREFFAQGLKNALTGFFQCIPGSASFTRSALDYDAGAETRFAAVMNALFVGVMFFLLASAARFIPYASLAGVLFVVAFGLMQPRYFTRVWRADRSDAGVFAATFFATILLPLQYAVFIGIGLNIAFYLRTSSRLHVSALMQNDSGNFVERATSDTPVDSGIAFLQVDGDLFFAVAEKLTDQLSQVTRSGARVIVLRLKRCHSIDATVLYALDSAVRAFKASGGQLILCGVREEVMRSAVAFGLIDTIGKENVFVSGDDLFDGSRRALRRAHDLILDGSTKATNWSI